MKHILTIQDISCVGRCSATVALPVLSAMGIQCSLLPTAVLSTHSGYPGFTCRDLTADLTAMVNHWENQKITFDGLYTGYLASAAQAELVCGLLARFRPEAQCVLVDPAMADSGKLYSGLPRDFPQAMQAVCAQADVIVPNLTEACLLTDMPYTPTPDPDALRRLLEKLLVLGPKAALITGVSSNPDRLGFCGIDSSGAIFSYDLPRYPQNRHGTGDLFAAATMGGLMQGAPLPQAAKKAADFILLCLEESGKEERDPRLGVAFEAALPSLWTK